MNPRPHEEKRRKGHIGRETGAARECRCLMKTFYPELVTSKQDNRWRRHSTLPRAKPKHPSSKGGQRCGPPGCPAGSPQQFVQALAGRGMMYAAPRQRRQHFQRRRRSRATNDRRQEHVILHRRNNPHRGLPGRATARAGRSQSVGAGATELVGEVPSTANRHAGRSRWHT